MSRYTPGVRIRFLPCASASLIPWAVSVGLARKNASRGSEDRVPHRYPATLVRASGTDTLNTLWSTYKNGGSRDTGVVRRLVTSPGLNCAAGAPWTPENT